MVCYECTLCDYKSRNKSDLAKHNRTKKHIMKINNAENIVPNSSLTPLHSNARQTSIYVCDNCNNTFTRLCSLTRHKSKCMDQYKKQLEHYKEQVDYFKHLFEEAGGLVKKSVSAITYTSNNYNNAPVLKPLKITDISEFNDNDDNDKEVTEDIISAYRHKTLNKYLGDIIVGIYKKDDPKSQSMWTSDVNRLTYLVKRIMDKNKNSFWYVDNSGKHVGEHLIKPMLDYIKVLASKYLVTHGCVNENPNSVEFEFALDNSKQLQKIVNDIDDNILSKSILKYIAPYFKFNEKLLQ